MIVLIFNVSAIVNKIRLSKDEERIKLIKPSSVEFASQLDKTRDDYSSNSGIFTN